jgi:hypothetical protein
VTIYEERTGMLFYILCSVMIAKILAQDIIS